MKLIDEGNTIPFIARYRKEAHGTLDDQVLRELSEKLEYLRNFDKRREEISTSITAQEKMTPEIEAALEKASTLAEIEDIYRPFRPKRRTRASIAKEKGLEPLADAIFAQFYRFRSPTELAADYIDAEKGVETVEDAGAIGAMDIIAETYRTTQISAAVCARAVHRCRCAPVARRRQRKRERLYDVL